MNMRSTPYPIPPSGTWSTNAVTKYGMILAAGAIVLFVLISTDQIAQGWVVLGMWSVTSILGGLACIFGVLRDRYRFEWMGCWAIVLGTAIYLAVTIVGTVQAGPAVLLTSAPTILFFMYGLQWTLDRAIVLSLVDMQARHRVIATRTGEIPEVAVDGH